MRIIFACSIFPPDIGGPAIYAQNLKQGLEAQGHLVLPVTYQGLKKWPQPLRFVLYFFALLKKARSSDLIYAFNIVSCGLPACLASFFRRKKFLIRIGGDFLWERAVESGRTKLGLREYYGQAKSPREKFWLWLLGKILRRAGRLIFTTHFQKAAYQKCFNIEEAKAVVIVNPFPETAILDPGPERPEPVLLFAGRLVKLKNLDRLIDAFDGALKGNYNNLTLKLIGEGPEEGNLKLKVQRLGLENRVVFRAPLPHSELLREIQKSYLCVLPSLGDVSPNFAIEAIKLGKPILLTKETGIYEQFKEDLLFIEPQNTRDIEEKIIFLLNEKNYQDYLTRIKKISVSRSWDDIVREHLNIFDEIK